MASTPLVCIIDDEADYRYLLQHLLNRYFSMYSVRFYSDGKEFLDELPQLSQQPDLILLDRHMPELDGHQTLLRLKQQTTYRTIPVVMMSADATMAEINNCYAAGANSFLLKPVDFDLLKNTLTRVFDYWLELNRAPASEKR